MTLWVVTHHYVGIATVGVYLLYGVSLTPVETHRMGVIFATLPVSSTLCHVTLWPLSLKRQCVSLLLESGLGRVTEFASRMLATPHKQKIEWLV